MVFTPSADARNDDRFRHLLDGDRWDNDWAADAYVRNDFAGGDSVVDLTALAAAVPPAARKAKAPATKDAVKVGASAGCQEGRSVCGKAGRDDEEIAGRDGAGDDPAAGTDPPTRGWPLRLLLLGYPDGSG